MDPRDLWSVPPDSWRRAVQIQSSRPTFGGAGSIGDVPATSYAGLTGLSAPAGTWVNPSSPYASVGTTPPAQTSMSAEDWASIQRNIEAEAAGTQQPGSTLPNRNAGAGGRVGAPQGRIPDDLNIAFGRGADWNEINKYDAAVVREAEKWGVDPALIKAAIAVESGGREIWNGGDLAGRDPETTSWGVLQMQRGYHRDAAAQLGYNLDTAEGQIGYFAALVAGKAPGYENIGATPEERYANMYPGAGGSPEHVEQYMHDVEVIRGIVDASGGYGGPNDPSTADPAAVGAVYAPAPPGSMTSTSDIWGGEEVPITQELGSNEGAIYNNNPNIYDYCLEYGVSGHCGKDYGLPYGTSLMSPIAGEVVHVGGPYYEDGTGGPGEIRIRADNGDIIIFGHMSASAVQPGDRVEVGDMIGASGQSDERRESEHLHLEVRVLQPDGSYRVADPDEYFAAQAESYGSKVAA